MFARVFSAVRRYFTGDCLQFIPRVFSHPADAVALATSRIGGKTSLLT